MFLNEYEYKLKERKLKRIIGVFLIICVVSVGMNIINARRSENIRQIYMSSIWHNLHNLEVHLSSLHFAIENECELLIGSTLDSFRSTAVMLNTNIVMLAYHQNFSGHIPNIFMLERHVSDSVFQISEGRAAPEDIAAFLSLLNSWAEELRELNAGLTTEWEETWRGEAITVRGPDFRMSARRFLTRIDTVTANIN